MIGAQLIMYESFQDVTGKKSTLAELCNDVSHFSRGSVLWTCSYIAAAMQFSDQADDSHESNEFLLDHFFGPALSNKFKIANFLLERRIVFHRRQLLFLSKLALLHSPCSAPLNASIHTKHFGPLLLKANDHFHYDLIGNLTGRIYSKSDYESFLVELLASEEFGHKQVNYLFARSHKMICKIAPKLRSHKDFVDLEALFLQITGLPIQLFEALVFGTTARFGRMLSTSIRSNPNDLPLRDATFAYSRIPLDKVALFLDQVSASTSDLALRIRIPYWL